MFREGKGMRIDHFTTALSLLNELELDTITSPMAVVPRAAIYIYIHVCVRV